MGDIGRSSHTQKPLGHNEARVSAGKARAPPKDLQEQTVLPNAGEPAASGSM